MSKLEMKFVNNIEGKFFVPSYQHGYRWGTAEVRRLLDDVYNLSNGNERRSYCLQPIVVKNSGDGTFEVIDGQQRLTTLFLIYKYMFEEGGRFFGAPKFSLKYETRDKSADFLANVDTARKNENIDFYFIANAYETVKARFADNGELSLTMTKIKGFLSRDNRNIDKARQDEIKIRRQ